MSVWQPIETAPKDGTIIMAYRDAASFGVMETVVFCRWWEQESAWTWPSEPFDVFDEEQILSYFEEGDFYRDTHFTHWMPLPKHPEAS